MTDAPLPEDRDSATDRNAATDQTTMVTQNATEQLGNDELPSSPTDSDEGLSYEQARDELIETVKILELGQMSLDESLKYWERGEALVARVVGVQAVRADPLRVTGEREVEIQPRRT